MLSYKGSTTQLLCYANTLTVLTNDWPLAIMDISTDTDT